MLLPFWRPVALATLIACLAAGALASEGLCEELQPDVAKTTAISTDKLIEQLGSDSYQTREDATIALIAIGPPAEAAVGAASKTDDAEVRYRCAMILRGINLGQLANRRKAFLDGDTSRLQANVESWKLMEKITGDTRESRELFIQMQIDGAELLNDADNNPTNCAAQISRMYMTSVTARRIGEPLPDGVIAAMVLIFNDDRVKVQTASASQAVQLLYQYRATLGDNNEAFRSLLVHWMKNQSDEKLMLSLLRLAQTFKLKEEGLRLAQKGLANSRATTKAYAILAIGQLGGKEEIEALDKLVTSNEQLGGAMRVGKKKKICKVGDVALAMCVSLSGQRYKDFGFVGVPEGVPISSYYYYGFVDDESRNEARKKWAEYRAKNKSAESK